MPLRSGRTGGGGGGIGLAGLLQLAGGIDWWRLRSCSWWRAARLRASCRLTRSFRKLASVGVWLNILEVLRLEWVSTPGARSYLCGCHILLLRSALIGGGDGGIGLAGFLLLRFFLGRTSCQSYSSGGILFGSGIWLASVNSSSYTGAYCGTCTYSGTAGLIWREASPRSLGLPLSWPCWGARDASRRPCLCSLGLLGLCA